MDASSDVNEILIQNPGDPVFVEHAETLRVAGSSEQALIVLLRGVSHNPDHHPGRLALARVFYELGFLPFATAQLSILSAALPHNEHIRKLLSQLAPDKLAAEGAESHEESDSVVAEADFDIDAFEELEAEQEK